MTPNQHLRIGWPLFSALREAYGWFYAAYREAADRLRQGERSVGFPEGAFPPALPFARGALAQAWREAA